MNYRSFEDCKSILVEIKSLFFTTLCLGSATYVSPLVIFLFFLRLLVRLYISCVHGGALHF